MPDQFIAIGSKILVAVILLIITFKITDKLVGAISGKIEKSGKFDKTVSGSLSHAAGIGIKIIIVACLLGFLGFDTGSLAAVITSLGVCVGLAVNGTLSNLAGGVMLLLTRPFKVDDYIEVGGFQGTVESIHIVNTKLRTLDNRSVYLPNSMVSTSNLINYNENGLRRVDMSFSVSYHSDFRKAENIILSILLSDERVLKSPEPTVRVSAHNASSIEICARPWCLPEHYWDVYFDTLEAVKDAFDKEKIDIPYPQMDVHIKNEQ